MARPLRTDRSGAVHHVFDRGNSGQNVFLDDIDRQNFLQRVIRYRDKFGVGLLSHCLMSTHFHLVPVTGEEPLAAFMHDVLTSYTRYFNDRWLRRGHLFQGRYGSRICKTNWEVCDAIRYTHMNPIEARIVADPKDWPWSSHRGFLAGEDPVSDVPAALSYFGDLEEYQAFLKRPLSKTDRPSLEEIGAEICGEDWTLARSMDRARRSCEARRRFVTVALGYGYRSSDLAKLLGCSPSTVSMITRRDN